MMPVLQCSAEFLVIFQGTRLLSASHHLSCSNWKQQKAKDASGLRGISPCIKNELELKQGLGLC